jgi:hypothetical protein
MLVMIRWRRNAETRYSSQEHLPDTRAKDDHVNRQPDWLRRERAYRAYVRGMRFAVLGFVLGGSAVLAAATGVVPTPVLACIVTVALVIGVPSVLIGGVGWLLVPDKNRANIHQGSFLSMVARDVFKGLPRD